MCQSKFEDMAKEAGAIYKLNKLVLVNCDVFEEYLETSRNKEQSGRICTYFLKLGVDLLTGNKLNVLKLRGGISNEQYGKT